MADSSDRPGYSFNPGPPPEASRFLKNKGLRPSFSWRDVEPEEHAVAFTVAKAMQVDVLETIREEVQRALDEGLPLAEFKRALRPRLQKLGWWGVKDVVDPATGEPRPVWLGSPRRLRTIYNANIRSARAAGQWERIERTKRAFPYLEYRLGPSENHRPHHAIKAGLILPADDPFWDAWMPPNGWGCKCWVRQVTRGEADRRGVDRAPQLPKRRVLNKRTGEMKEVPVGIDPGWERNPGKLRAQAMEQLLADKLEAADPGVARAALRDIATSWRAERVLSGHAPGAIPVAILPRAIAAAAGMERRVVQTTSDYGQKFLRKKRGVTTETLLELGAAADTGTVLLERRGGSAEIYLVSRSARPWLFVLKALPGSAEIWVRTMVPLKANKLRDLMATAGIEVLRE